MRAQPSFHVALCVCVCVVGAKFGNPQMGAQIGGIVQQVGGALGYGK